MLVVSSVLFDIFVYIGNQKRQCFIVDLMHIISRLTILVQVQKAINRVYLKLKLLLWKYKF